MENRPNPTSTVSSWAPSRRVYLKAVICLVAGLAAGYVLRGTRSLVSPTPTIENAGHPVTPRGSMDSRIAANTGQRAPAGDAQAGRIRGGRMPSMGDMKQMADTQAAPLLEKLKSDPNNSILLSQVGAIYHTTHQFKEAGVYYERAVKADPKNVALRTKLASSLYRDGDVDGAIAQLNRGLKYDPKDANALFDLGVIKLHGKQDGKGALAAWQELLKSNPQLSADQKATVQKLMAEVLTMLSDQKGIQGAESHDGHKSTLN